MIEELQQIFNSVLGRDDVTITEKTAINKDVGINSLGYIEVINRIEDFYDVEIPNSKIAKFKTVGDIVKYLSKETDK